MHITDRLKLTGDAAWIPYAKLNARDFHWARIGTDFNGPTPEDGHGHGVQLEAILSYDVTRAFSVGIGGRYWRIQTPDHGATAHFDVSAIGGGLPQDLNFKTERYGGFVQASYIFGAPIVAANYCSREGSPVPVNGRVRRPPLPSGPQQHTRLV